MRIPGEAFTLDASGSHAACPRGQSGKNGRGMQPKGLPKRSAEICALMNEKAIADGEADADANMQITYR